MPTDGVYTATGDLTEEEQARREAFQQASMEQAGEPTEIFIEPDYFGEDDARQFMLPGSRTQYVMLKAFTEGDRREYLDKTNRNLTLDRTGTASLKTAPGSDRAELLRIAITDFNLNMDGTMYDLSRGGSKVLEKFLTKAKPSTIDAIVKDIHKINPWLLSEMSLEDMRKERESLDEMIALKEKEQKLDAQF